MQNDVLDKPKKKKRSLFFPIIKFTFCLAIVGAVIYFVVPSVASKQEGYVSVAKQLMDSVGNFVERDDIRAKDTNTTYYIPASCVEFHNKLETPYGNLNEAYVIVTYNGSNYKYYWISKDSSNYGVKEITSYNDLSLEDIKPNIDEIDTNIGIENKENIVIYNKDCSSSEKKAAYSFYNPKTGIITTNNLIEFVNQQNYGKISIGDELVIGGKEHFYVISTNEKETTLLAKYNLYVGYKVQYNKDYGYKIIKKISKNEEEYGIQSFKTTQEGVGVVPFSSDYYWTIDKYKNIYNGSIYNYELKENEPVVKEVSEYQEYTTIVANSNNYSIAYYIEPYVNRIQKYGVNVLDARLLTSDEATGLDCSKKLNCLWYRYDWLMNTSFWLGSIEWNGSNKNNVDTIEKSGAYTSKPYNSVTTNGVRPVLVIDTSSVVVDK